MKSKALNVVAVVALILMIAAAVAIIGSLGDRGEPIGDHTHAYKVVSNTATCETAGEKVEICTICEAERRSDAVALGHNLAVVSHVEPTCVGNGIHNTKCTRCEYTESEVLKALGHTYVLSSELSATCTEGGVRVEVCSTCKAENRISFDPVEHVLENHEALAATCTEPGHTAYEACKNCSYSTMEEVAPLGHDEVAHEAVASTCKTHGNEAYVTCSRCDYTTFEELPLGEHHYAEGTCSACGRDEAVLSGTWVMNDEISYSEELALAPGGYTQAVNFTWLVELSTFDNRSFAMNCDAIQLYGKYDSPTLAVNVTNSIAIDYSGDPSFSGWQKAYLSGSPLPIATSDIEFSFDGAQTVSEEFYDWFVANATKVVAE